MLKLDLENVPTLNDGKCQWLNGTSFRAESCSHEKVSCGLGIVEHIFLKRHVIMCQFPLSQRNIELMLSRLWISHYVISSGYLISLMYISQPSENSINQKSSDVQNRSFNCKVECLDIPIEVERWHFMTWNTVLLLIILGLFWIESNKDPSKLPSTCLQNHTKSSINVQKLPNRLLALALYSV